MYWRGWMWRSSIGSWWVTPSAMPGRQDGDLVHRVGVLEHVGQHGVAALVVGDALLLGLGEHHRLAALAEQHPVARRLEVGHGDLERCPGARRAGRPR